MDCVRNLTSHQPIPSHVNLGNEPQRPDSTRDILIHDEDKATDIEIRFHSKPLGALL